MKLTDLPYLTPSRADALYKSGIHSPSDLLMLFPNRYIDRTHIRPVRDLAGSGEQTTVVGRVTSIREAGYGRKKRLEVTINDDSASLKGVWFRGTSYFKKIFKTGDLVAFFGQVKRYGRQLTIAHPEVDHLESEGDAASLRRLVPVYPFNKEFSASWISQKLIHDWINHIMKRGLPGEFLPEDVIETNQFPARDDAFQMIHNPEDPGDAQVALERFKFEELFLFELSMSRIRHLYVDRIKGLTFKGPGKLTKQFFNDILPFSLTDGQKEALGEIRSDFESGYRMHRLLQGDVGSGKTVVAAGAILMALDNGYQAAFMAPTEILAEQHFHTLTHYLQDAGVNIRLLTGGQKTKLRTDILTDLEGGNCDIVVGTHAIIQDQVRFYNLGLAVVDEQHRFGVKQRSEMLNKGGNPHLLVMSATPIPRSLAMTLYSDLDISVIRELPAGRKPIKTAVRTEKQREDLYQFMGDNLNQGGQAYIIYPLVEESELVDLKDATKGFEQIQSLFPDFSVGLLHGRMKSDEKESVMKSFYDGQIHILVTTTVIEVGVDVPNANVMVVEHAERFGLSQLHQLRGRIGRGERQSYCILIPGEKTGKAARFRLRKMVETTDGFEIAEADLKLRGPGDFLGTKQSGLPEFKYANIVDDRELLTLAKKTAWALTDMDPALSSPELSNLKRVFEPYFKERMAYYGLG